MKLHTLLQGNYSSKTFDIKIMTFPPALETLDRLLHEVKITW